MEPVLEVIFSLSEDYNYLNQQVCSEFRQMIPKVLPSSYLNQLIKDDKTPEKFRPCQRLLDIALERDLVYLLQACKDYIPDNICKLSIKKKSIKVLKWALDKGYLRSARLFRIAIKHGNFKALLDLKIGGCEWDSWVCSRAAKEGYLRILKWLRENGWFHRKTMKFFTKRSFVKNLLGQVELYLCCALWSSRNFTMG
ncbi:Pseudo ankyrin repeat-like [Cedratvirus A11]|uniref:Pseudo ankyrin repeat-like n=1 Tax=Cedratvirus A11 TaxID=1903266 RepID=A0A1M7XUS4_9VIRU|nr:Pseudo ankyrin repeat-like [Cedratvirus A11]SHO33421.1 Pseudo ankyrin repeat-like [Cedratvirus A11]